MPSSVSIQIENPKTKSVRVEQETFDLQFQTTNTDEVFLNGEKIDAQKGFNQRELNLQDGENEIELSVIDHYTGEKKSITTNIIYISPKMKEQEEFIKNYPLPKIEVISSLTPETTEKEYILQVRAENTTKLKLNGKIMEESEGVFEKRILLEHKSTKIILEAENLHKEIVENFIVSREETQEEKSLREEKRLNSISNELKELEMILKEIPERDFSIYYDSISKIDLALNLFHTWAEEIKKAEESPHLEKQALGEKIRSAVVKKQVIEFPRLRKAYGKISANKLWVNDIEVSVYGSSNSVIEYTGGVFAANRNIREAYTIVKTQLRDLRFDQANYKWYSGDDEYTYYTIGSRLDTEIVY
jgi:hypothetical protein